MTIPQPFTSLISHRNARGRFLYHVTVQMLRKKRRPLDFHDLFFLVLTDPIYLSDELVGHLLHLISALIEIVF
jgi:hypothetical protein